VTSTQLISVQKHLTIFWALREAHPAILEARGVSLASPTLSVPLDQAIDFYENENYEVEFDTPSLSIPISRSWAFS
jgi:hypothetical protein